MYKVQIYDGNTFGHWRVVRTSYTGMWDITCPFSSAENAVLGIQEWGAYLGVSKTNLRVIDDRGDVYWTSADGFQFTPAGTTERSTTMSCVPELAKPLNLKRAAVIDKLEKNLTEESDKRKEAEQKEKDARNDFRQFILDHEEQIVNYVARSVGGGHSWKVTLERAEELFKDDAYKSPESKPTRLESALEKIVRVLKMGADETVEIVPTNDVFALL